MISKEHYTNLQEKRLARIETLLAAFETEHDIETARAIDRAIDRCYGDAHAASDAITVTELAVQSRRYMDVLNALGWA